MKTAFLGRDLTSAFGIPPRQLQYWMEQGFIKADISNKQPRVYSISEAIICGLTAYFTNIGGYYPTNAARIARLAFNIFTMWIYSPIENLTLDIYDGEIANSSSVDFYGNKNGYSFFIKYDNQNKPKSIKNITYKSLHMYMIGKIIQDIIDKLGGFPKDEKIKAGKDVIFLTDHIKEGTENIWIDIKQDAIE